MEWFLLALVVFGIPFVLPIVAWVSARRTRARLEVLLAAVEQQRAEIERLNDRLRILSTERATARAEQVPHPVTPPAPIAVETPPPRPVPMEPVAVPTAPAAMEPASPAEIPPQPRTETPPQPRTETPPGPSAEIPPTPILPEAPPSVVEQQVPTPPPPPEEPPPAAPAFDWESLIGVRLFSAIAGIALVLAAVFFLRYSIEHGWLQPPVRVAIGTLVALALLVVCELKAARRYPVTANALDAAAIAILFATFFAAHALWDLIPGAVAFVLLALVTATAVLLSIRRESLFIAVLGLLGGFSTPVLLSTGENQPIPLFAYLLLLNIGLAWVAYRQRWPLLTWLTLILTALYQWGWVFRFLDESSLTLAMTVFLIFPLASVTALIVGGREPDTPSESGRSFEWSAALSAALPLFFAVYLATVPAYGAHASLLFGFLLLIDVGLMAIGIARRQELLHAAGGVTTLATLAVWMAVSYSDQARTAMLGFSAAFVTLYLFAPAIAAWFRRPFAREGLRAQYVAPLLLFAFSPLAALEPSALSPWPLFGVLLGLIVLIAWRAIAADRGSLYHVAAFFAIAAQAVWSASSVHLSAARLGTAVSVYAAFGLLSIAVPVTARRVNRPLRPMWGSGAVLLASLPLLLFLSISSDDRSIWALALLLAILNAGLFVEGAAGGLPTLAQVGSVASWLVLANWWGLAAGSVGILSSLAVVTILSLVTLGGHAWSVRSVGDASRPTFARGLYLGLIGHLFLLLLATNRAWALPPGPLFGALLVVTLATSAASLASRAPALHASGGVAAALVVSSWAASAGDPAWGLTALLAAAAASVYALGWLRLGGTPADPSYITGAIWVLFVGELTAVLSVAFGATPPFVALVVSHALTLMALLVLAWQYDRPQIAVAAVAPAWLAVAGWQLVSNMPGDWAQLLILASVLYAIFAAHPLVLGRRARDGREPYVAAVLASVMAFFAARAAFEAGGLESIVGIVPVVLGAVLAILLRALLRLEAEGERDLGRLALVAGASLGFITVAIPLQLERQWITIGWALEGAALAWLYGRVPHRGLLYASVALLATVFARLAMNPEVLVYEPRGAMRILNWYLYTYVICAAAMFAAAWWLSRTNDRLITGVPRPSTLLPGAAVGLLFLLLNIEIADYFATGPTIAFRFGVTVSQDLTYTIGWLAFGMILLAAGIYVGSRAARVTSVALIAVTTFKCFLYDLGSLEGLYRVASFVGLAISLALVSLALQKYVLSKPRGAV